MKFEKQTKVAPKIATSLIEVVLHNQLNPEDYTTLRKHFDVVSNLSTPDILPDDAWYELVHSALASLSKADRNYFLKKWRLAFVDRIWHSSDWKEDRYLEKGDVDAALEPIVVMFDIIANTALREFCGEFSTNIHRIVVSPDIIDIYINFAALTAYSTILRKYPPILEAIDWLRNNRDVIWLNQDKYERIFAALLFMMACEVGDYENTNLSRK